MVCVLGGSFGGGKEVKTFGFTYFSPPGLNVLEAIFRIAGSSTFYFFSGGGPSPVNFIVCAGGGGGSVVSGMFVMLMSRDESVVIVEVVGGGEVGGLVVWVTGAVTKVWCVWW